MDENSDVCKQLEKTENLSDNDDGMTVDDNKIILNPPILPEIPYKIKKRPKVGSDSDVENQVDHTSTSFVKKKKSLDLPFKSSRKKENSATVPSKRRKLMIIPLIYILYLMQHSSS